MIDDRISKGKRVLIHCQLGVSRSASLVIAYGLYKNPDLDFNAMYGIVKERSCWVGPNMSLIYQLTDFRSRIRKGDPPKAPLAEWFTGERSRNHEPSKPTTSEPPKICSASPLSQSIDSPFTGPDNSKFRPVPQFGSIDGHCQTLATSAVSNPFNWTASLGVLRQGVSSRPLPLREKYQTVHAPRRPPRYDANQVCNRMLYRSPLQTDLSMRDVVPTTSLLSPRAAEFCTAPFARNMAGDLAFRDSINSPSGQFGRSSGLDDPRSPPQKRDPLIMRNIDEFL
jgi:tyrosine-protein phosphatase